MNRWARVLVLFGGGAAVALGAELAQPGTRWAALALIGGAIAAGELILLRPPYREAIPISFAFMVVLLRPALLAGERNLISARRPSSAPLTFSVSRREKRLDSERGKASRG